MWRLEKIWKNFGRLEKNFWGYVEIGKKLWEWKKILADLQATSKPPRAHLEPT